MTKPEEANIAKPVNDEDEFMDGVIVDENWNFEELNQLTKSLKMIPAGTKDR